MKLYTRLFSVAIVILLVAGAFSPVFTGMSNEITEDAYSIARNDVCETTDTKHLNAQVDIQGDFIEITFNKTNVDSLRIISPTQRTEIVQTTGFVDVGGYYMLDESAENASITTLINEPAFDKGWTWTFTGTPRLVAVWRDAGGVHCSELFSFTSSNSQSIAETVDGKHMVSTGGFILVSDTPVEPKTATLSTGSTVRFYTKGDAKNPTDFNSTISTLSTIGEAYNIGCTGREITLFSVGDATGGTQGRAFINHLSDSAPAYIWTYQGAKANVTDSVIAHEYVHTRQCYTVNKEMDWILEGSADYRADQLMYTEVGTEKYPTVYWNNYNNSTLTKPDSWAEGAQYAKGEAAIAYLDYQIQQHSSKTFEDVERWMNNYDRPITYRAFRQKIVQLTDKQVGIWMDKHIDGDESISPENTTEVEESIFGSPPKDESNDQTEEHPPTSGVTFAADKLNRGGYQVQIQVVSMHNADEVIVKAGAESKVMTDVGDTVTFEIEEDQKIVVVTVAGDNSTVTQTFTPD